MDTLKRVSRRMRGLQFSVLTLTLGQSFKVSEPWLSYPGKHLYYKAGVHPSVHAVHPSIQQILIEHQFQLGNCAGHWEYQLTLSQLEELASQ